MRNRFAIMMGAVLAMLPLLAVQGCAAAPRIPSAKSWTGTIRVVGNEPFTHVVLTVGDDPDRATRDQDYLITGPLEQELRKKYQWRKLVLEGKECAPQVPGFVKCLEPSRIVEFDK